MSYPIDNGDLTYTFAEIGKNKLITLNGRPVVAATVLGCEDTPDRWAELVNFEGEEIILHTLREVDELIEALQRVRTWMGEAA